MTEKWTDIQSSVIIPSIRHMVNKQAKCRPSMQRSRMGGMRCHKKKRMAVSHPHKNLVVFFLIFRKLGVMEHILYVVIVFQHFQKLLNLFDRLRIAYRHGVLRNLLHFGGEEG